MDMIELPTNNSIAREPGQLDMALVTELDRWLLDQSGLYRTARELNLIGLIIILQERHLSAFLAVR